jgi:signal transduction histidine kinase
VRLGLRWQILVSLVTIMVATVLLVSLATVGLTGRTMEAQERRTAERLARIAVSTMGSALRTDLELSDDYHRENLQRLCELFSGQFDGTRVSVMAETEPGGAMRVAASYPLEPAEIPNEIEVLVARASGRLLSGITTSAGVRQVDVYAPIRLQERTVAVLRLQYPLTEVQQTVAAAQQLILLYMALDALLIIVLGLFISTRFIVRPVEAISAATERVASGDLETSIVADASNELGDLARNFERMVIRLRENRDALNRQVSELADSKAALERTQDELVRSEKLATVGGLAAGIAHEIGNPLAAVIGLLEFVQDRDGMAASDVDDLLGRVDREVERISNIINDLLDYARVGNDVQSPFDVRHPLETAIQLCTHHPKTRSLGVTLTNEGSAIVVGSESRLVQVVLNLLLNAGDACPGGEVRVSFKAECRDAGFGVRISVIDDGPGISEVALGQLFEPFFTTKGPGKGTGLGLAMSQRIVEQMRGEIWAENVSQGAAFYVWLPAPPANELA